MSSVSRDEGLLREQRNRPTALTALGKPNALSRPSSPQVLLLHSLYSRLSTLDSARYPTPVCNYPHISRQCGYKYIHSTTYKCSVPATHSILTKTPSPIVSPKYSVLFSNGPTPVSPLLVMRNHYDLKHASFPFSAPKMKTKC